MKIGSSISRLTRNRSAFTLSEVLVAIGIVSVLFVALYLGMSFGFAVTKIERENLRATQIMVERLEGIRLFTWDQMLNPAMNPPTFTEYFTHDGTNHGIVYTATVTITTNVTMTPATTYSTNVMLVNVRLVWTSGNLTHSRSMSTYVSRRGVQNYVYGN